MLNIGRATDIVDWQKQKVGVTTVSGVDVVLFSTVVPGPIAPDEGIIIYAGWHHSVGVTSTTYKLSYAGNSVNLISSAVVSGMCIKAFVMNGDQIVSVGQCLAVMGGQAGGTLAFILPAVINFIVDMNQPQTLQLLANAASNVDVIVPDYWLIKRLGTGFAL